MSQVTRAASKAKFETADVPTQADFVDLHDSVLWIGGENAMEDDVALTVVRTSSGVEGDPIITMLLKNTSEVAGGSDYQNEVHLRLQAGATADHRRYINFAGYDGVDQWLTGVNASKTWILYNAVDVQHRVVLYPSALGGHSNYGTVGTGAFKINETTNGETDAGTGGLEVWNGGPFASRRKNHILTSSGYEFYPDATRRFYIDANGAVTNVASSGSIYKGQNASATKFEVTNSGETGFNTSAAPSTYQHYFNTTASPTTAFTGIHSAYTFTPTADNANHIYGVNSTLTAGTAFRARLTGFFSAVTSTNTGTNSEVNGYGTNIIHNVAGTLATMRGVNITLNNTNASGVITAAYGIHINAPTNTGSINALYGIRIEGQTVGTISGASYGLYCAGTSDKNYIGGTLGIGITTPQSAKLHIISTTEQQRTGYDASNYYSTTVGSTGGVTFNAVGSGASFTFSDNVISTQYRLSALNAAPASASDTGTAGEIRITADYIYVCTATNTWVRTSLATW
jgi:hypothetical protein